MLELDLDRARDAVRGTSTGASRSSAARTGRTATTLGATAPGVKPKAGDRAIGEAIAWQQARGPRSRAGARGGVAGVGGRTARCSASGSSSRGARTGWRASDRRPRALRRRDERQRGVPGAAELAPKTDAGCARLRAELPEALLALLEHRPLAQAAEELREAADDPRRVAAATGKPARRRASTAVRRAEPAERVGEARRASRRPGAAPRSRASSASTPTSTAASDRARRSGRRSTSIPTRWQTPIAWTDERCGPCRRPAARPPHGSSRSRPTASALDDALARWRAALDGCLRSSRRSRADIADDLEARLRRRRALIDRLLRHPRRHRDLGSPTPPRRARCEASRPPSSSASSAASRRGQVVDVLRRSALEALADELLEAAARGARPAPLGRPRPARPASTRRSTSAIVRDAAHRVMDAANERRPNAILGVAAIIAARGREEAPPHAGLASCSARTAPVAQAVKPCFMMSPLSVSQFLPPDMRFDVVIFDEASQVRPATRSTAIYRGRRADRRRRPEAAPADELLRATTGRRRRVRRGRARRTSSRSSTSPRARARSARCRCAGTTAAATSQLIAFSNHRFYDGELVTFPSAGATRPTTSASRSFRVDGVYRRGTRAGQPDRGPARSPSASSHHADTRPTAASASSPSPRRRRRDRGRPATRPAARRPELDELFADDRLDGFFVKNLENVQGDERDVIIFSVGYGPDEHGKLTMNFGPLNREGGERRLNVAITRARRRVEVVCSIRAASSSTSDEPTGVAHLRRYLDFAARGPRWRSQLDDGGRRSAESPFEEAVLRTLRCVGLRRRRRRSGRPATGSTSASATPSKPGAFALGIECDGAMYHSSRVARDRDRLREQVLGRARLDAAPHLGPELVPRSLGRGTAARRRPSSARCSFDRAVTTHAAAFNRRSSSTSRTLVLDAPPPWAEPYAAATLPPGRASTSHRSAGGGEMRQARPAHRHRGGADRRGPARSRRVIDAWGDVLSEKRRRSSGASLDGARRATASLVRHGNALACPTSPTDLVRVPTRGPADAARGQARAGHRARRGARPPGRRRADRHRGGGQAARRAAVRLGAQRPGDPGGAGTRRRGPRGRRPGRRAPTGTCTRGSVSRRWTSKEIRLASRPVGEPDPSELRARRGRGPRARRRRDRRPQHVHVRRPVHARAHERGEVLRRAVRDRQGAARAARSARSWPRDADGFAAGRHRPAPARLARVHAARGASTRARSTRPACPPPPSSACSACRA